MVVCDDFRRLILRRHYSFAYFYLNQWHFCIKCCHGQTDILQQFLQGIQNHFAKITDFVGYLYILRQAWGRSATVLNFLLEVVLELTGDWYDYCHFQLNRFHFSTRRHIANVQFREKLNNSHVQFHFSAWSWCPGSGEMVSVLVYSE